MSNALVKWIDKNVVDLMIGAGIGASISATIKAVKATPKALDILQELKEEHKEDRTEFAKNVVLKVAPCYIPAVLTELLAVGCMAGAGMVSASRNAALATAYSLTESAYREYKEHVVKTIGEKKEQKITDEIASEKPKANPPKSSEVIFPEKQGTLFYDPISCRYFRCSIDRVKRIVEELNMRMFSNNESYISLNEFYYEVELPFVTLGDKLGFNVDDGKLDIGYTATVVDPLETNGEEVVIVLDYGVQPKYGYQNLRR